MPGLMQPEAEFGPLPLSDHTYALDSFPSDEVPTVLAFEEVESEQRPQPQSLFSIVEEHAYAHRIQRLPDDDWTNLPGIAAGPDSVNAAVQTEAPREAVSATAGEPALSAVEPHLRFASVTVQPRLLEPLQTAASRLGVTITLSGSRVRCRRLSDLLRLLSALELPPRSLSRPSQVHDIHPVTQIAIRTSVRQQSGRTASRFDLENLLGEPKEPERVREPLEVPQASLDGGYHCSACGQRLTTRGSFTRHQRTCKSLVCADERPFACAKCPARYKRSDSLREHCFVKHRESGTPQKFSFQCSSCFKVFKRKSTLQDHMNRHVGALTYNCPFCGQRFPGRAGLRYHIRSRHQEAVEKVSR